MSTPTTADVIASLTATGTADAARALAEALRRAS